MVDSKSLLLSARAALLAERLGEILGSIGYVDLVLELGSAKAEAAEIAAQLREKTSRSTSVLDETTASKPTCEFAPWTSWWPRV